MSRHGKIARLSWEIREELNVRLRDGETGVGVLAWLNELPRVQAVLARDFEGRLVTEQNLSDWRAGGFAEWLRAQEAKEWVLGRVEDSDALTGAADGESLEVLAAALEVEMGRCMFELSRAEVEPLKRHTALMKMASAISQLRRGAISSERWDWERERWNEEQLAKARAAADSARMLKECAQDWVAAQAKRAQGAADGVGQGRGSEVGQVGVNPGESS